MVPAIFVSNGGSINQTRLDIAGKNVLQNTGIIWKVEMTGIRESLGDLVTAF